MKTRYIVILGSIVIGLLIFVLMPFMIDDAFNSIDTKLQAMAHSRTDSIQTAYQNFEKELELSSSLNEIDHAELKDSFNVIYRSYSEMIDLINHHHHVMQDSILGIDPNAGLPENSQKDELSRLYWLGTEPSSNWGSGNGNAEQLSNQLLLFELRIAVFNHLLEEKLGLSTSFRPSIFHQKPGEGPWAQSMFADRWSAALAKLNELQLDVQDLFLDELSFVKEAIHKKSFSEKR